MNHKKRAIPVIELAKIINVNKKTLMSWLCHYSLTKYCYHFYLENGTVINMFTITNSSLTALKKYLSKKRIRYLDFLESGMAKIKKYYT